MIWLEWMIESIKVMQREADIIFHYSAFWILIKYHIALGEFENSGRLFWLDL